MRNLFSATLVTLALTTGQVAMAQDTTVEGSDAGEFDIGQEAGPAVGQPYVLDTFGAWDLRCIKAPEGQEDSCAVYQLLFNEQGNAVSEVNIFPLPEGGQAVTGARIIAPLETLLGELVTMAIDGQNPRSYPFAFCNRAGCIARAGFTQDILDSLKAGAEAQIRIVPAASPDTDVVLPMPLTGFTAAYDALLALDGE